MNTDVRRPAIRVAMMPRDTNVHGTIFGGVMLSHIDQAGALAARAYGAARVVTVCMKEVVFKKPVYVGDVVSFYTTVTHLGTTSVTVKIDVEAERLSPVGSVVSVTEAEVVYVGVDEHGNKMPIRTPIPEAYRVATPPPQ
jgi:acyl-CoA thioesterase YciA